MSKNVFSTYSLMVCIDLFAQEGNAKHPGQHYYRQRKKVDDELRNYWAYTDHALPWYHMVTHGEHVWMRPINAKISQKKEPAARYMDNAG